MKYYAKAPSTQSDEELHSLAELAGQAILDAKSVGVFPGPGVVEEILASRGIDVTIEVNGLDESETVGIIRRKPK